MYFYRLAVNKSCSMQLPFATIKHVGILHISNVIN